MRRVSYGSQSPFALDDRRASSIYSEIEDAWRQYDQYRDSDEHSPRPVREDYYKASRSIIRRSMSEPQLLLPRTYQPLRPKPSPVLDSELVLSPEHRPSQLLPPPPVSSQSLLKDQLQTISLAKAKALIDAPGSQHLLPEELRARKLKKSSSVEQIGEFNIKIPQKPGSAYKPRESPSIRLPSLMMFDASSWSTYDQSKHKAMAQQANSDPHSHAGQVPKNVSQDTHGPSDTDRGRSRHRVPRKPVRPAHHSPSASEQIATEYANLLPRHGADTCVRHERDHNSGLGITTDSVYSRQGERSHADSTKRKPATSAVSNVQRLRQQSPLSNISPKHVANRDHSVVPSTYTLDSRPDSTPPPMFATPESPILNERHAGADSRTGSIPISPPFDTEPTHARQQSLAEMTDLPKPPLPPSPTHPSPPPPEVAAALAQLRAEPQQGSKRRKKDRESAYYPYVGRRRYGNRKGRAASDPATASQAAGITRSSSTREAQHARKGSDVLLDKLQRVMDKAGDAAERVVYGPDYKDRAEHKQNRPVSSYPVPIAMPQQNPTGPASPPHLSQSVTGVYLGWTEESKDDFDASKPVSPKLHYAASTFAPHPVVRPLYEHSVTPARPLDERKVDSDDAPTMRGRLSRSGSIFGSLIDRRRERGLERRRENIKKSIRMLPANTNTTEISRPELAVKSISDKEVPVTRPSLGETKGGLWGRRISEFGLFRSSAM